MPNFMSKHLLFWIGVNHYSGSQNSFLAQIHHFLVMWGTGGAGGEAGGGAAVPGVRAAVEPRPGGAEDGGLDEDHGGGQAGELELCRVAACSKQC